MRIFVATVAAIIALAAGAPVVASAADYQPASPSQTGTRTYNLDFTLPTAGKSGCMVCHGDPNLVKVGAETTTSIYIDIEKMNETAHVDVPCSGCHTDFAYKTPHDNTSSDAWRTVAKSSCKNCHPNEFTEMTSSSHSPALAPGETASETAAAREAAGLPTEVPVCGDCHGGHEIYTLSDDPKTTDVDEGLEGRQRLHPTGLEMCGGCHEDYATSYDDYYHGSAYRRGAPDAPACWQCHSAHTILPAEQRTSTVHKDQLPITCGQCHDDIDNPGTPTSGSEKYTDYSQIVHKTNEIRAENQLWSFIDSARMSIQNAIGNIRSMFTQGEA